MSLGFYFNNARCTGCRTCAMACADFHDLTAGHLFRHVMDYEGGTTTAHANGSVSTTAFVYHVSLACNHCDSPACVQVCPTGAMHKNALGLVSVDNGRCIGCGYCTIACPYHAPSIDATLKQSSKCDGCTQRVEQGKRPICVEACPLRALEFGSIDELLAAHPNAVSCIVPLPDESHTAPNLLIDASPAALRAQTEPGAISNAQEWGNNVDFSNLKGLP